MRHDRMQLLATIADLYYIEQCSQAEIARQTGYSRSAVSRLLTEAHENGVVEIKVNHPLKRSSQLEAAVSRQFDLTAVYVAQRGRLDYERTLRLLGRLSARYLDEAVAPDSTLGISWGTAVHETAQALRPRYYPDFRVVQMIGAVGISDPEIDGHDLARVIGNTFSCSYHTLNAPLVVDGLATTHALLQDRVIRRTISYALECDFALVGIGSTDPQRSSLLRAGHLTPSEVDALQEAGAVGDICGRVFDADGRMLEHSLNDRVIGIDIRELAKSDCIVVGVAGGRLKAPAILAALRGGLVDVLITDSTAAEALVEYTSQPAVWAA